MNRNPLLPSTLLRLYLEGDGCSYGLLCISPQASNRLEGNCTDSLPIGNANRPELVSKGSVATAFSESFMHNLRIARLQIKILSDCSVLNLFTRRRNVLLREDGILSVSAPSNPILSPHPLPRAKVLSAAEPAFAVLKNLLSAPLFPWRSPLFSMSETLFFGEFRCGVLSSSGFCILRPAPHWCGKLYLLTYSTRI